MQGRGLGELVMEHFIGVAMLEGKFEIGLAGLRQGAGPAKRGEKLYASLKTQRPKNIFPVTITFVDRRRGGASGLGHGAHGERFFPASGAQSAGGFQDALFELWIWLSGHLSTPECEGFIQGPNNLNGVQLTMYNI